MRKALSIAAAILALSGAPGLAQQFLVVPGVQAPVPAPPPPAAVIQPVPNAPPKVDTFGDRVTRCMHHGGVQGLPAGPRDAYVRACANN